MKSESLVTTVAAGIMVVAVGVAAFVAAGIQRQRQDLDLVVAPEESAALPPQVALTTAALGSFRGLAVDFLWARADHLQSEGEFFEAQTLSQWITTLQPRFQKVWAFQAWNLAYNIAAASQQPLERWSWVRRGIGLLRDRGIPLNPRAPNLYMELGWIYHHKIAGKSDKEHWYFKARIAREMQEFLGNMTTGLTTEQSLALVRRIAEAPATLEELERRSPGVRKVVELLAAHAAKPDEDFMRTLGRALMLASSLDAKLLGKAVLPADGSGKLLAAIKADPESAAVLFESLVPHLQRRILEDRYRMEPKRMLALMERYGPLDWRHAESHGIYWTERGIDIGREIGRREDTNELLIIRSRLHMLAELMKTGRVDYDPVTDRVDLLPDPRFIAAYERSMAEAVALITSAEGVSAGGFGMAEENDLANGYETFLNLAVILEYLYGDRADAERHFLELRSLAEKAGRADDPLYADTLESFIAIRIAEVMTIDVSNLRQFIDAMIRRAIFEGLAKGNLEVFNRYVRIAHGVYDRRYAVSTPGKKFVLEESQLLPFPKLVENSFASVMRQASMPALVRARIWAWSPETLRDATHAGLAETLRDAATAAGLDPDRAFPPPEPTPAPDARTPNK